MVKKVLIEVVAGSNGPSLYVSDEIHGHRVAGPKPWAGASLLHKFEVDADELIRAINQFAKRPKSKKLHTEYPADIGIANNGEVQS